MISLQCLWLKRIFGDSFHEIKVVPLFYTKKTFSNNFKHQSNLDYKLINKVFLLKFFKKILSSWMIGLTTHPGYFELIFMVQ